MPAAWLTFCIASAAWLATSICCCACACCARCSRTACTCSSGNMMD
nr:MAG TPA: Prominin [Caudoviricetes sp.]